MGLPKEDDQLIPCARVFDGSVLFPIDIQQTHQPALTTLRWDTLAMIESESRHVSRLLPQQT